MTISTQIRRAYGIGNGAVTSFPHSFYVGDAADVDVYLYTIATDTAVLIPPAEYTLAGVGTASGSVTYNPSGVPIPATEAIITLRTVPLTQLLNISNQSGILLENVETALDKLAMQIQQNADKPDKPPKALTGYTAQFDASGNLTNGVDTSTFAADVVSATTAASSAATSATNSATSETNAALSAASVNLPAIVAGDLHKRLKVKADETGYDLIHEAVYNVKDYGALGQSGVDDYTAIMACIAAAEANTGINSSPQGYGTVVFPVDQYFISQTINITKGITVEGYGATIEATFNTGPVIDVKTNSARISGLTLISNDLPASTYGVLEHTSGADCIFKDLFILGGWHGIYGHGAGAGDSRWTGIKVFNSFSHLIKLQNYTGFWGYDLKVDPIWPAGVNQAPTAAETAWVGSTAYTVGTMVYSGSWRFQCTGAGTSAASGGISPTKLFTDITDGTVTWQVLWSGGARNSLFIDSECFVTTINRSDFTGANTRCLEVIPTTAGAGAQHISFGAGVEFGGGLFGSVLLDSVSGFSMDQCLYHGGVLSTSVGVDIKSGDSIKIANGTFRGFNIGIQLQSTISNGILLSGNTILDISSYGVDVKAGATDFAVINNDFSGNTVWGNSTNGVIVRAGASDRYYIIGNIMNTTGVTVSDSGTGTDKVVYDGEILLSNFKTGGSVDAATISGAVVATSANMKTATAVNQAVSPGRQHFHPGHCKGWVKFIGTGTPSIQDAYNMDTIFDAGVGLYRIDHTTDMADTAYAAVSDATVGGSRLNADVYTTLTTSVSVATTVASSGAAADCDRCSIVILGNI